MTEVRELLVLKKRVCLFYVYGYYARVDEFVIYFGFFSDQIFIYSHEKNEYFESVQNSKIYRKTHSYY